MAEDLGKRLLVEVEELGLDEIFYTLRLQNGPTTRYFQAPPLDRLIQTVIEAKPAGTKTRPTQPIIELSSTAPGGGKTRLLYHLTAIAVLPSDLGGKAACTVIIDADGAFSIPRLAQQLHLIIVTTHQTSAEDGSIDCDALVLEALKHVHMFRPQSLASTIATLDSLPAYLFDKNKHYSFQRPVGFIALDSASAFYWQAKAQEEDAALLASTAPAGTTAPAKPSASAYAQLTTALKSAAAIFCCPVIFASWHLGPAPTNTQGPAAHSVRPSLPAPLSQLPTLRFIVQRVPIRKFPAGISVEEARHEAADRQRAVEEGKFECVVNEWGVTERTLQRLQRIGAGFGFRVKADGLIVEATDEQR